MANFNDIILFDKKSLSDIFKQIHKNNKDTDKQITELIDALKPIATTNAGSAVMLMPNVVNLIDVNVKNNEQLIKMAGIVQRASSNSDEGFDLFNSPDIQKLLDESKEIQNEGQKLIDSTSNIQLQIDNK